MLELFVRRFPRILGQEIRSFFVKFNDPSYVKLEKLEVLVHLTRRSNV
jgi:vesicle coat complex subunit